MVVYDHLIEKEDSSKLQSYAYVWTVIEDDKLFGDWDYEVKIFILCLPLSHLLSE